jgi:hypothetical protein
VYRAAVVDGQVADAQDHLCLLKDGLRQQVLEAGVVDQRPQFLVVGHGEGGIVAVEPMDKQLEGVADVEAGGAGIGTAVAFRFGSRRSDVAEDTRQEGEVAHVITIR